MQQIGLNNQTNSPQTKTSAAPKVGFWKRQFQSQPTKKQKFFDWAFGVVLPTLCCLFDPAIFKGAISNSGALLGEYKPFAYLLSFVSIVLMMMFLLFGQKLKWFNAVIAGLFIIGAGISLIVGVIVLPFSLIGLIILIGALGFTPLIAAFVYFRNAIRAISHAESNLDDTLLFSLVAVSAIFSFVLPYLFYVNVETALREMETGNAAVIRENTSKLRYVAPLVNVDRLGKKSCGTTDENINELRKAIYELSEMNDDAINRQYCNDW